MKVESTHTFARQVAMQNKALINTGDSTIGKQETIVSNEKHETPFFETDTNFSQEEPENNYRKISYDELRNLGFIIDSVPVKKDGGLVKKRYLYQQVNYVIVKEHSATRPKAAIPNKHYVELFENNQTVRLVGKNAGIQGVGPWVPLTTEKRTRQRERKLEDYSTRHEEIIQKFYSSLTGIAPEPKKIYLKELPVMITERNEIVCIEQGNDEPRMGFFGQTGSGKSLGLHAVCDMVYWHPHWRRKLAILNDVQGENETWCEPNTTTEHLWVLRRLGLSPKPLPMIYLHPHIDEHYEVCYNDEVGFRISLPYDAIIEKFDSFFDLGASEKYFQTLKEDFKQCRSKEALQELLDKSTKMEKGTKNKILATLGQLLKLQITDVNANYPSTWTVIRGDERRKFNPVTACLYAGLVPCLRTIVVENKNYFPQYFKFLAGDIYYRQNEDMEFKIKNEKVWLVVDEVLSVAQEGKPTVASDLLTLCFTQGRIRRIGMLIATQNFRRVPSRIKSNLQYLFFFNNPSEAGDIVNEYQLPRHFKEKISTLKKFECVAYTTNRFIVYDKDGRRTESRGPFFGRCIPPMSQHKKPLAKKKGELEEDYDENTDELEE